MSLPGAGRVQVQRNPADRPSYYDDMRFLNKAGGYTGIGLQATLPVVMNNLQYAEPWIDTANAYIDYSRALGGVDNYLTATEFLGRNGGLYFDQVMRPGTQFGLATNMAVNQINPYLTMARGLGGLTSNEKNPYGAIPVIREFNQGLDRVVTGMNQSPFGQYMGKMGGQIYDNSIGRLYGMDNGFFRGVGNIASIPGEVINTGGNVLSGLGGLIREGYQAIDRNVFNNVLPGGSDITDEESMEYNNPFEENPAEGLVDAVTDIGDSFKNLSTLEYEGFDDANRAIIDRYVEKGIPMEDAVAIMNAEQQRIATSGEGYADPADAIRYAEIDYTPEEIEYYSGLMQQAMADPAQNPFLNEDYDIDEPYVPPTSPEDQAIIDQGLANLEEQAGDLADVVIDTTPDEPLTEDDLLDLNALSPEVLDMLENDMYSDYSIEEMQKFADLMGYETPEGLLDLTEQEKLSIAGQYAFDEGQYKEHLNELEQMEIDSRNQFDQTDYLESIGGLNNLNTQMKYWAGKIDKIFSKDEITDQDIDTATQHLAHIRGLEDNALFNGLTQNNNPEFVEQYQSKINEYKSNIRSQIDQANTKFANAYKSQYETKLSNLTEELQSIRANPTKQWKGLGATKRYYTEDQRARADQLTAEIEQLKIDAEVYANVGNFVDNLYDETTTDTLAVRDSLLDKFDTEIKNAKSDFAYIHRRDPVTADGTIIRNNEFIANNKDQFDQVDLDTISKTISATDIISKMDRMTPEQIQSYRPPKIVVNDYISTYNPSTDQYSIDYDLTTNTPVSSGIDLRNASTLGNASGQPQVGTLSNAEILKQAEEIKANKAQEAKKAQDAKKAQEAIDAQKAKEAQRLAEISANNASRAVNDTLNRIQQNQTFGNVSTYRGGSGNTMLSGGYLICWVAREVYGADNPKWLQFRDWMINDAPNNVRESYLEHGASLAEYISNKPNLKSKIRIFMDSKIGE